MNYRSTAEFKPPFRVYPTVEEVGPYMVDVIVKLRADFPSTNNAANVTLTLPLPKATVKASCSLGPAANGQSVEYRESHRQCVWYVVIRAVFGPHIRDSVVAVTNTVHNSTSHGRRDARPDSPNSI